VARTGRRRGSKAADELRPLDDPYTVDLLHDLDRLRERLNAELGAAGFDI
jgi:hypothetical protein